MNKLFIGSCFAFALSFLMACGPKVDPTDAQAVSEAAINRADQNIQLQQAPLTGTLPSLHARYRAAKDSVNRLTITSSDMSREKSDKIYNARDKAKEAVQKHYAALMGKELAGLVNKEFPVIFNPAEFSSGKITVFGKQNDMDVIKVHVEMVFADYISPFRDKGGKLELLDSEGNVINTLTAYRKFLADCRIPETETWSTEVRPGLLWDTYFLINLQNAGFTTIRVSCK